MFDGTNKHAIQSRLLIVNQMNAKYHAAVHAKNNLAPLFKASYRTCFTSKTPLNGLLALMFNI